MKKIIDCATGEVTEREINKAEKDQQKIDEAVSKKEAIEAEAKAVQKQAIAAKLGLTADELKLLLG